METAMDEAVRKVAKNTIGYTRNKREKSYSARSAKRPRRRTLVERMPSIDEREQQKTNIDKPDR
jgi:hypothetical protein